MATTNQHDPVEPRDGATADAPKPLPKRKKLAWWVYVVLIFLILVAGIGGFYGIWYYRASAELAAEIAAARDRGEPVWFADLEPEPIAAIDNAAPLIPKASLLQGWTDAFDAAHRRANEVALFGDEKGHRKVDDLELKAGVDANAQQLNMLRQALERPRFQYGPDYRTKEPQAEVMRLGLLGQDIRWWVRILNAEFHVALAEGDQQRAFRSLHDTFRLAALPRDQPFLIGQYQCGAFGTFAIRELEILLSHSDVSDEQARQLDALLATLDSFRMRDALLAERAMWMTTAANIAENMNAFSEVQGFHSERFLHPLAMEQQAIMLRQWGEVAALVDEPGSASLAVLEAFDAQFASAPARYRLLQDMGFHRLPKGVRQFSLGFRQLMANARLGLRADRYYRKHGRLPANLRDVLDEQLTVVPTCLFSEKPLIFKPQPASGFLIYGPGDNGIDDGGDKTADKQEGWYGFRVLYELPKKVPTGKP